MSASSLDVSQGIVTIELFSSPTLTEVEHLISAIPATERHARLLHIRERDSCLVLNRKTWTGQAIATVNTFTYVGSRYSLGSRYLPPKK
ncbi:UTRA domain-containing protein [Rhizobium favelukesii]|uniref:UTRA domain-containing protein n=1 Tax=Rhizobium favelukesii TaxID=348824 RepID=UPI003CC7FCE0